MIEYVLMDASGRRTATCCSGKMTSSEDVRPNLWAMKRDC